MDVYQMVTDRIIEKLEQGTIPWQREWSGAGNLAIKRVTGKPYSLLNQFLLEDPGEYLTWNQCHNEGGTVKKGAKSKIVVFWRMLHKVKTTTEGKPVMGEDGQPIMLDIPFLQYSNVFHIKDCAGLKPKHYDETRREFDPIEKAESVIDDYVQRSGIIFEHEDQGRASYSPMQDRVLLPLKEQFTSEPAYYSTAFHELTHSTGHRTRLNRQIMNEFGSADYSKEELVAEIGSATILNLLGIETDNTIQNNAAYVQNWIKALRNDKRMIVSASGKAAKAVEMIVPWAAN